MRTRFLNIDYFASAQSASETLTFLTLPIPDLPSRLPSFEEDLFQFDDPEPNIFLHIGRLPIQSALSKFLSDVTPHKIEVDYGVFLDHQLRNAEVCAGQPRRFSSGNDEIRYFKKKAEGPYEDGIQTAYGCEYPEKNEHKFEVIQFEVPELDEFLEKVCDPEQHMQLFSEVPEIENDPDSTGLGLNMQSLDKLQESVYSVEHVTLEFDIDKKACVVEDDDSCQEQMNLYHYSFPLLEVDDTSLRDFTNPSGEDDFLSFLENMKSEWDQNDSLLIDGMELCGSMQYDAFEFLSNHCILRQNIESELASMDALPGMDIISLVDNDSSNCSLALSPLVFQESEFLEFDSSQIYEFFFSIQITDEPVSCDWMFREDKFKNFNELIVSCELALVDDTFKTMPVPIISDNDRLKSSHAILEEILAELKPISLSASDGIYLDWHLLEEDKYNNGLLSFYENVSEELVSHNMEFVKKSFDNGKGIMDIVLLDDALNMPNVEEHMESVDTFPEDILKGNPIGIASGKLLDARGPKSGNAEHSAKGNAEKATLLFKSMSQFNDLDFFLNPGKVIGGGKNTVPKAHGTDVTSFKKGEYRSALSVSESMDEQQLEIFPSSLPSEDKQIAQTSEAADKVEACSISMGASYVPYATKSEQTQEQISSFPEIIIVMNTQNLDQEMLVSRRSTYQKILALEKEGFQVVERDLDLPVDIVIISSICLVWYDCRNIRKKATAVDEATSCLPSCIESIATNVLTLLSFTFSCCILVFEGDTNFLSTVMESSDGIYAAAASLGVDLQLFCSYSSELTDEIILRNISYAAKLYRCIYPKMPESETLAESFLSKFPSINPLTAHAILSSVGILIEFFEWSNKRRVLAVQQYNVPEESITLFSASCSYGEREDSKSIMTDCSSSVSSGPDSNKGHFKIASEANLPKCIQNPPNVDICVDDLWPLEPSSQFPVEVQGPSGVIKHDNSWMSRETGIHDELQWSVPSLRSLSAKKQGTDFAETIAMPYDLKNFKDPLIFDEFNKSRLYSNNELLGLTEGSEMITKSTSRWNNTSKSENLYEDPFCEVIDLTDSLGKDVPPITNYMDFSTFLPESERDSSRKSKTARRLSFDKNSAVINSDTDLWSTVPSQGLQRKNIYPKSDMHLNHLKMPFEEMLTHRSAVETEVLPFKEEMSLYGRTPLSKAIHSSHPQPGSPWTMEFLNGIREKCRLRQQSLPSEMSTPEFEFSGNNISKVSKKRSQSILEFFKYKGGSNSGKVPESKKKQSKRLPGSSKSETTSTSSPPTRTPLDKRSRQTLSFEKNGSGSQTRLVWTDGSTHRLSKKLRNQ